MPDTVLQAFRPRLRAAPSGWLTAGSAPRSAVGDASTVVRLRLAYYLPINLREFVGHVGVWADVNAVLEGDLQAMKARAAARARQRGSLLRGGCAGRACVRAHPGTERETGARAWQHAALAQNMRFRCSIRGLFDLERMHVTGG